MILKGTDNILLTPVDRDKIKARLACVKYNIPPEIELVRNKGLSSKHGKGMACFSMLHPDVIFLAADADVDDELISKIGHEMLHRAYYRKLGKFVYGCFTLPGLRQLILEPPAYKIEEYLMNCFDDADYEDIIESGRARKKEVSDKQ